MKKVYSLVATVVMSTGLFAQTNLGLETWAGTPASLNGWGILPWTDLQTDFLPTNLIDQVVPAQGGTITIGGNPANFIQQVSTGASEGTHYVELSTVTIDGLTGQGAALNGINGGSISQTIATTSLYSTVTFKYKATIQTGDAAFALVEARKNGTIVSQGQLPITVSAADWTTGTITMPAYTDVPDTVDIIFVSSAGALFQGGSIPAPVEGTKLMVDDIKINVSTSASIDENELVVNAYPNPANNVLNIKISEDASSVSVIGLDGKLVSRHEVNGNSITIDVDGLNSGIYFYEVVTKGGNIVRNSFMKN